MPNQPTPTLVELHAVPIFRVGRYPQGEFDLDFIQQLADSYDPQFHEAPNYLAHADGDTKDTASNLAFGWVKRLYVKGDTLYGDFVNVPQQFAELVLSGRIKKRSVEIYSDLAGKGPYLRAVAWPLVPEVKGLTDVHPTQVFGENRTVKNQEQPEEAELQRIHVDFQEKETGMTEQNQFITPDELQLRLRQLRDELKTEQEKLLAELEVKTFCEQMVAAGKMTPAERVSEEPLLITQRQRELTKQFAEDQPRLSDQRMDYYRNRAAVLHLDASSSPGSGSADPSQPGPANPDRQKLLRYFHENQDFFTRMGVTFDDLAEVQKYEKQSINPLVD